MTTSVLPVVSFNHDSAVKGFGGKRPENVRFVPEAGAEWTYFDAEGEGTIKWLIESIDGPIATLVKLTGRDPGYKTRYELEKLDAKRWKPVDMGSSIEVLWACPHCGGGRPIEIGDYVCLDCREALDSET